MSTETQTAATPAAESAVTPQAAPAPAPEAQPAAAAGAPAVEPTPTAAPAAEPAKTAEPKPADKPQGAPEEYAEFTAPEGMAFDTEAMTEFKALAKEKGLSQEDAQKFADLGSKAVQKALTTYNARVEEVQAQWASDAKADKEFGGDKLDDNMAVAKKALDAFGTPELSKLLMESKMGNHPEVIRAFYRVGKAISEDRLVPGGVKPAGAGDPAAQFYPSMNKS